MTYRSEAIDVLFVASRAAFAAPLVTRFAAHAPGISARRATLAEVSAEGVGTAHLVVGLVGSDSSATTGSVDELLGMAGSVPVIVVDAAADLGAARDALRRGAAGYLRAGVSGLELAAAVERVLGGETVLDMGIGGQMVAGAVAAPAGSPSLERWGLRAREQEVLEGLIAGRSNREIAADLHLGEETVKTYLRAVYRKLGARDRAQAIANALRHG